MGMIKKIHLAVFGDFKEIQLTQDTIASLLPLLGDQLLPMVIPVKTMDPVHDRVTTDYRINLTTKDGKESIVFFMERIDYNINFGQDFPPVSSLSEIIWRRKEIFINILEHFGIVGSRLAFNGKVISDEDKRAVFDSLIVPSDFFDTNSEGDWSLMRNHKKIIDLSGTGERVNHILKIACENTLSENPKIEVLFDINSSAENKNVRFKNGDINKFFEYAIGFVNQVLPI